jgi:WhiB family redox-sensing transcriptional regulator
MVPRVSRATRRIPGESERWVTGGNTCRLEVGSPTGVERSVADCKGGRGLMGMITDWPTLAACQNGDPDALFVQGAEQNVAKRICRSCPVRYECLADALDNRIEFGVWGGMTERERRALLRRHPQVASWRKMFEAALRNKDKSLVTAG